MQDEAELPHVGALIGALAREHLGRDVVGRPRDERRRLSVEQREAEVGQHEPPVGHAQHVVGRDVAVRDAGGVDRREAVDDGARVVAPRGPGRQGPSRRLVGVGQPAQGVAERARAELHRDEPVAVHLSDLEDAPDVGVHDRARHLHLAHEPTDPALVLGALGEEQLDGDGLAHDPIEGAEDHAAAALAQDRLELEPPAQHPPDGRHVLAPRRSGEGSPAGVPLVLAGHSTVLLELADRRSPATERHIAADARSRYLVCR